MWSHDEQKEINDGYAVMARITCKHCGAIVHKYVESHYAGDGGSSVTSWGK